MFKIFMIEKYLFYHVLKYCWYYNYGNFLTNIIYRKILKEYKFVVN